MKICVSDACNGKFSKDIVNHWRALGHEVKTSIYPEYDRIAESDLVWFDWVDNSLIKMSREKPPKRGRIIARLFDIDYYANHYGAVDWEWVNDLIFINDRIMNLTMKKQKFPPHLKIHRIDCGINLDRFTFKSKPLGRHIAFVGRLWIGKNVAMALRILATLRKEYQMTWQDDWHITILGSGWHPNWYEDYCKNLVKVLEIEDAITWIGHVPDVNEFLEDKDYLLLTSFKEAFSYVVGESLAKGIKAIIHAFPDAEKIWPKELIFSTEEEAVMRFHEGCHPIRYRKFIEERYPLKKQLEAFDKILKGE